MLEAQSTLVSILNPTVLTCGTNPQNVPQTNRSICFSQDVRYLSILYHSSCALGGHHHGAVAQPCPHATAHIVLSV